MREGEPSWFYVGNGLLQYKDSNGWTDQYQEIDSAAQTSGAGPPASHDGVGPVIEVAGRGARGPSSFAKLSSWAAHALIAGLVRLMTNLWRLITYIWPRLIAGLSHLASLARRLITGPWPLIAEVSRKASAGLPIRSVARSHRVPSKSSVFVDRELSLMKRSRRGPPRREVVPHRSREVVPHRSFLRLGREQVEADLEFFLDPERLRDINPDIAINPSIAGVDQPVSISKCHVEPPQ